MTAADTGSLFAHLEVSMSRWRDIERCLAEPPPFIYTATQDHDAENPADPTVAVS